MRRTSEVLCAGAIALAGAAYVLTPPSTADWASARDMIRGQFETGEDVQPLSPEAARVALSALALDSDPVSGTALAGLTASNATRIDLGQAGQIEVAVLDDDRHDTAYQLFSPRSGAYSPVVLDPADRAATLAVSYERRIDASGENDDLDVSITPRAGVSVGPDGSAAGAGAEVRIGQYLRGDMEDRPRWYAFAGADRRALRYDPRKGVDMRRAMALTDRQVVGDAQAGIAVRIGEADLSLAYVRREYKHVAGVTSFDETEEFGAVTVNWTW